MEYDSFEEYLISALEGTADDNDLFWEYLDEA